MIWPDRHAAGRAMATALLPHFLDWHLKDSLVVALPRGGVILAYEIARALKLPLSTWSVRKISLPSSPEVAVGAVAPGGFKLWDPQASQIPPDQRRVLLSNARAELQRRQDLFHDVSPKRLVGKVLILVDDGVATGYTLEAAIISLLKCQPSSLVVAVPVIPLSVVEKLQSISPHFLALDIVDHLSSVGQFYRDFQPVSSQEASSLLEEARRS